MSELIKKLAQAETLREELTEAQQNGMLKGGMLDDLLKDIMKNEFGIPADTKEIGVPTLLKKAYMIGYKEAKAEK